MVFGRAQGLGNEKELRGLISEPCSPFINRGTYVDNRVRNFLLVTIYNPDSA